MSGLLGSDPASWRRHAAQALASCAWPVATPRSSSSTRCSPPSSAVSLQISSFTAVFFRAHASEATREVSSSGGVFLRASHSAGAAPALAKARECVNAPLAGSRGSSPLVRARTAAQVARSAAASVCARNTATRGSSTRAFMNAPLQGSLRVAAAATTAAAAATPTAPSSVQAGHTSLVKAMHSLRPAKVSRASSQPRTAARVSSASTSASPPSLDSATHVVTARTAACIAPAPVTAGPHPATAPSPVTCARSAAPAARRASGAVGVASATAAYAFAATDAGCSPRPSGPAYVLSISFKSTPCSSNSLMASSTASSASSSKSSMLPCTTSSNDSCDTRLSPLGSICACAA
mmetsp:Transcript_25768/g.64466  ORF Transcript_25768/g.64466 Transcript_25768/m.64466 type:complete len:350 (-) Transcript_25768:255-1304(-)